MHKCACTRTHTHIHRVGDKTRTCVYVLRHFYSHMLWKASILIKCLMLFLFSQGSSGSWVILGEYICTKSRVLGGDPTSTYIHRQALRAPMQAAHF